ncbi:MAG: transcriptional regulator [Pseudomonadota bacterium]
MPARPRVEVRSAPWHQTVLEAVGRTIDYWGFKRNHGRLWTLLYLEDRALDATTIGRRLGLSKGAVSIVLRELEGWSVVRRVAADNRSGVAYAAERDLWLMIETVLRQREARLFGQVRDDLRRAEREVAVDPTLAVAERRRIASRIRTLRRLADLATGALTVLLRSRRLDLGPLLGVIGPSRK